MTEFGPKFVDTGERSREPRERARLPGLSPGVGSSAPANARSLQPAVAPQRSARGGYVLALLVVAALAGVAFVLGRLRASSVLEPSSAQQVPEPAVSATPLARLDPAKAEAATPTPQPQRRELALIPFVSIEVEPAHGEIWLDRKVAGVGRVQLGAIDDGALHELQFMAPEHETKSLFFRNTPPAGRVVLQRIVRKQAAASGPKRAVRSSPVVAAAPPVRARPSVNEAPSEARALSSKAPRVQLIDVRMPRVEVLD